MTPPLPRGSASGSTPLSEPSRSSVAAVPASDAPAVPRLRLSLESSFLAVGNAGFPVRGGVLFSYRPNPFLGFGLHADTNFTDHFSGTARLEGIWPAHRYFHLEGAFELGARALLNQPQTIEGMTQPLSGAAFTFGAEVAASIPFSDVVGLSIFGRAFYSPGGGLTVPLAPDQSGPARGVSWSGGEVMFGLRLDFYPPVDRPHRLEPVPAEASRSRRSEEPVSTAPRDTLRDFEDTVAQLLRDTPGSTAETSAEASAPSTGDAGRSSDARASSEAPPPDVPGTDAAGRDAAAADAAISADTAATSAAREEILALQREIQALTGSVSSLETEIQAATQLLNDLSLGQEAGQPLHIRLDRLYDSITDRPGHLDLAELNNFLREFRTTLHDSDPLRLLTQSATETFGPAILQNLEVFRTALTRYQRSVPVRAGSGGFARADLDAPLAALGALIEEIQMLRSHPETTEPPASQVSLWRVRLERIREHITELTPRLTEAQARSLSDLFQRLQSGFDTLTAQLDETRRNWLVTRALYSHYQNFRAARRPAQALAALRGIETELHGAPDSYRRLRQRNLTTLRNVLEEFVARRSANPVAAWSEARETAVSILHWIDPAYTPPALAEPRTARRRGRHSDEAAPTFRFPDSSGGGTDTGRREE